MLLCCRRDEVDLSFFPLPAQYTISSGTAQDVAYALSIWSNESSLYSYTSPGYSDATGQYVLLLFLDLSSCSDSSLYAASLSKSGSRRRASVAPTLLAVRRFSSSVSIVLADHPCVQLPFTPRMDLRCTTRDVSPFASTSASISSTVHSPHRRRRLIFLLPSYSPRLSASSWPSSPFSVPYCTLPCLIACPLDSPAG